MGMPHQIHATGEHREHVGGDIEPQCVPATWLALRTDQSHVALTSAMLLAASESMGLHTLKRATRVEEVSPRAGLVTEGRAEQCFERVRLHTIRLPLIVHESEEQSYRASPTLLGPKHPGLVGPTRFAALLWRLAAAWQCLMYLIRVFEQLVVTGRLKRSRKPAEDHARVRIASDHDDFAGRVVLGARSLCRQRGESCGVLQTRLKQ